MNLLHLSKTIIHASLTFVSILFIITGLGISNYQLIEPLTGGALSKPISFQIHTNLLIPFITLLSVHIGLTLGKKFQKKSSS